MVNLFSIISFLVLIISITIHEFSHALIADILGDPTPRSQGRLSLNPIKHADLFGTIIFPLLGVFTGIPTIGWAKPVQIDPYNLKNPKKDETLISLAGPASNFLLAIIIALLSRLFTLPDPIVYLLIVINVSLAVFNLLPVPPLDGSKIFLNLLPEKYSLQWQDAFNQYGLLLLIFLILPLFNGSNLLGIIIYPIVRQILLLIFPSAL